MSAVFSLTDVRDEPNWEDVPAPIPLDQVIRAAILNALAYCDGNQTRAGRALGIGRVAMGERMQKYGIPRSCGPRYGPNKPR